MLWIIGVIIYFILLLLTYIFILKRIKQLSLRQMENTGIETLKNWYKIVRLRMVILLIILFILGSLFILTITENEFFYKVWLRDYQETLDSTPF